MFGKNDSSAPPAPADILYDRLIQGQDFIQSALDRLEDRIAEKEKEFLLKNDSAGLKAENPPVISEQAKTEPPVTARVEYRLPPETELEIATLREKLRLSEKERNDALNRADVLETEYNLLKRERDLALRSQTLSPEQKQNFVRLEHESYKIAEINERLDYVIETVRTVLEPAGGTKN